MKRISTIVLAIILAFTTFCVAPIASASNDLSEGSLYAGGEIDGTKGFIDVEFTLPQENVLIYGLQFDYTLPKGVKLAGTPQNKIGNEWEMVSYDGHIHLYNHKTPLNDIKSNFGATYSIVSIPVQIDSSTKILPGRLDFTATLTSVAIGNSSSQYGFCEGIDYCDTENVDFGIEYIKAINGATVSGIKEQVYDDGFDCEQYDVKVTLDGVTLTEGIDYELEYTNNIYPGKAEVKIVGINSYKGEIKRNFIIIPDKVQKLKVSGKTAGSLKISWSASPKVDGYYIYRSRSANLGYALIKTQSGTSFTDTMLPSGKYFYYRVCAYKKISGKTYSGAYASVAGNTNGYIVKKPESLKVSKENTSSLKLTWKVTPKANGYYIYRSTKKDSGFKKIKTISSPYTTYYTDKKLSKGKTYYYRVYAYRKFSGEIGVGDPAAITAATKPSAPSIKSVSALSGKKAKITVKKLSGADGYSISISTSKSKGFKTVYTGSKTTYTKKSLKAKKTYYVKVRAYKISGGKKIYGSYSKVKSVKIKK